MVDNVQ